jgi:hypothetical protein
LSCLVLLLLSSLVFSSHHFFSLLPSSLLYSSLHFTSLPLRFSALPLSLLFSSLHSSFYSYCLCFGSHPPLSLSFVSRHRLFLLFFFFHLRHSRIRKRCRRHRILSLRIICTCNDRVIVIRPIPALILL